LLDAPSLAFKMGRAARQRYEQLLHGRAMGDAYAKLYERLLQPSRLDRGPAST